MRRESAPRAQRGRSRGGGDVASTGGRAITSALDEYRNGVVAVGGMTTSEKWNCVGALGENKAGGGGPAPDPSSISSGKYKAGKRSVAKTRRSAMVERCRASGRLWIKRRTHGCGMQ